MSGDEDGLLLIVCRRLKVIILIFFNQLILFKEGL